MSKKKPSTKENLLIDVKWVVFLLRTARENNKKHEIPFITTSVVLYSAIAEFYAVSLLALVKNKINLQLDNRTLRIINEKPEKTNLETIMEELRRFIFPLRDEILSKLGTIKKCRNTFFHDLPLVPSKEINLDEEANKISKSCEELIELYSSYIDNFYPK